MIHAQSQYVIATEPLSYTNGATASLVIDTIAAITGTSDWNMAHGDYLVIDVALARTNSATNTPTVFKLQHSDITNATGYADIAGSSFTSAFTSMSTSAGANLKWLVDTRPLRRYVKALVSPQTTQIVQITANLSRNAATPVNNSATDTGTAVAPITL